MIGARHAPPKASAMVEALRGLGYSPAGALADIIDNSIAAHATHVELLFDWQGPDSSVRILDDGVGMSAEALDRAMRLGERNPLEERHVDDLGRFGLGLKTASFSQARRLTVASTDGKGRNCLRWDLDVLASAPSDGWYLLEGPDPKSAHVLDILNDRAHGTLVVWDVLDRILTQGFREQDFHDLIDQIERHLSMVFHRYLAGPRSRLTISINGKPIGPWDPFMSGHLATWSSPVRRVGQGNRAVEVQAHVLPHKDRLSPAAFEDGGGPDGWTAQQGFYVYRNERLLVAGSWLGLGHGKAWTKDEACKLARIRVDLPNTVDADWKIDIRKSSARPPAALRANLRQLATDTRERARKVFIHRGQPRRVAGVEVTQAWRAERLRGGLRYRIDEEHPAVAQVIQQAGELASLVRAMLRVIEETVPVQRIWLDTAEAREPPRVAFSGEPPDEVRRVLQVMFDNLVNRRGLSTEQAIARLLRTEPFNEFPDLVAALSATDSTAEDQP